RILGQPGEPIGGEPLVEELAEVRPGIRRLQKPRSLATQVLGGVDAALAGGGQQLIIRHGSGEKERKLGGQLELIQSCATVEWWAAQVFSIEKRGALQDSCQRGLDPHPKAAVARGCGV